ncbi:MAG: cysteine--tRNA ligase [Kiritimatiellia bacterium]
MSLHFYNTLTRSLERFEPLDPTLVRMYTCGPTVYNYAHIGNFRAYVFEDILKRHLLYRGYKVLHIMNLTDVDDKTIRGANEAGLALNDFTKPFIDAFFEDLKTLSIIPADRYPAATGHLAEMIAMIRTLLDKGIAYRGEDGSIYFSIEKFPEYGKLAHLDREGMRAGARVAADEYAKDNVADFALWKAWTEKDGPVKWDSPFGPGRPGWHIECSAMAMKYLGETFDIHCGGVDNIFPHHEDEIAQSEACTGRMFVKTWLHCEHLVVDGKKMSKSLGNFFTLRDLIGKGFTGREVRMELLAARYRQSLNFSLDGLGERRAALNRIDDFRERLTVTAAGTAPGAAPAWAQQAETDYTVAMDDDLNTPEALVAVFDMVSAGNRALNQNACPPAEAAAALAVLDRIDGGLGILKPAAAAIDPELQALLDRRAAARKARDWPEADRIRDEFAKRGWAVKDTAQGPKLSRI